MAPVKTFQVRSNFSPWLSETTKELMKERNNYQRIASETKKPEDWLKYKLLRNKINNRLKSEKINWQKYKLENCDNDSAKLWKNVLGWLNWTSSGAPSQLLHDGKIETKPSKLANVMNNFFVQKVKTIQNNLSPPKFDPISTVRKLMQNKNCQFNLQAVHPDDILKIISNLKNSKSSGVDYIDTSIIKLAKSEILPAITHIVNLSIKHSVFPSFWKTAKVIPILKKGDPCEPKNYRPVAILPILSKILEKIISQQIIQYLNENDLFHPNHHGFRANHNTTTALIQMYDTWVESVEKGELVGVCMLDMSAAFDVVDHRILLNKMKVYGFDNTAISWVTSYLSDRQQCVYIDGCLSSCLRLDTGVPQGSILGPLFYILFTNDLPEIVHSDDNQHDNNHHDNTNHNMHCHNCGSICCFADDSTYSVSEKVQEDLSSKLTEKYKTMSDYMISNRLKLNDDKTHLLLMTTNRMRRNNQPSVEITTPAEVIQTTECEKLLGAIIHEDLKWTEYIQNNEKSLLSQLNTRLNALKKLSKIAGFKTRLMVANGIFMSKLIYLIALWGGCETYLLKSLQIIQNKAARAVTKVSWDTPIKTLLLQCNWMSVNQLVFYHSVVTLHKVIQTEYPKYFHNKVT